MKTVGRACAVTVVAAGLGAVTAAPATAATCGSRTIVIEHSLERVEISAGGVRCAVARSPGASYLGAGPARQRNCGSVRFTPQTEDGISRIRAHRAGCRVARRVARASRGLSITRGPYRYRARGFRCRGQFDDTALPVVRWQCTKGSAIVLFERT